jgi:plastocyanin
MKLLPFGIVLVAGLAACRQTTAPLVPLQVSLESSQLTATAGDTITFTVHATGNNLVGVVMDFGDSATDQYAMGGALTARVTFKHAFRTTGTFTVSAVVTDAVAGEKEASVGVLVN